MRHCSKCGEDKDELLFRFRRDKGYDSVCKACKLSTLKSYRKNNKSSRYVRKNLARTVVEQYKAVGCQMCGYNKCYSALDLHHSDPSKKDGSVKEFYSYSLSRVKKELEKCIVLCANCHREVHHNIRTFGF